MTSWLTADEVAFFNEHGYVGPFEFCKPEEMQQLRRDWLDDFLRRQRTENRTLAPGKAVSKNVYQLAHAHRTDDRIYDWVSREDVAGRVRELLDSARLYVWNSNFWMKDADSYPVRWHSDYYAYLFTFWPEDGTPIPPEQVSVASGWMAIDSHLETNGCLKVLKATHKRKKRSEYPASVVENRMIGLEVDGKIDPPTEFAADDMVSLVMEPGQFYLLDFALIHGSAANTSDSTRWAFSWRYAAERSDLEGRGIEGRWVEP